MATRMPIFVEVFILTMEESIENDVETYESIPDVDVGVLLAWCWRSPHKRGRNSALQWGRNSIMQERTTLQHGFVPFYANQDQYRAVLGLNAKICSLVRNCDDV